MGRRLHRVRLSGGAVHRWRELDGVDDGHGIDLVHRPWHRERHRLSISGGRGDRRRSRPLRVDRLDAVHHTERPVERGSGQRQRVGHPDVVPAEQQRQSDHAVSDRVVHDQSHVLHRVRAHGRSREHLVHRHRFAELLRWRIRKSVVRVPRFGGERRRNRSREHVHLRDARWHGGKPPATHRHPVQPDGALELVLLRVQRQLQSVLRGQQRLSCGVPNRTEHRQRCIVAVRHRSFLPIHVGAAVRSAQRSRVSIPRDRDQHLRPGCPVDHHRHPVVEAVGPDQPERQFHR